MSKYLLNSSKKLKSNVISLKFKLNKQRNKEALIRTKEEAKFFDEDNNYIDYFVEIGEHPEIFKEEFLYNSSSLDDINKKLIPKIISKFPESNKKSIVINNNIINQIFPHGFKALEAKSKPDPFFFAIMSDNQLYSVEYKYKYLSCLIIYESISEYRKLYETFFIQENTDNNNYNNYYIPKCLCIVSVHPCIDKFEEILKTIYEMTMSNKYNNIFVNQLIEELVIRTPKIPPGYKKVKLKINEKEIDLTEQKINNYPFIHIDLTYIFGLLNIYPILDIFKFILFEGNVIFFSSKINELTTSIMSFLFLISPFKYQYQVISILPKQFYSYLESDIPFILGINERYDKNFFETNNISLKNNIILIVNLDEKNIEYVPQNINNKDIPEFPKHIKERIDIKVQEYYKLLISSANKNLDVKENGDENDIEQNLINNRGKIKEKNEQYQIIFYKFMVELLEEYPKYLKKDVNITNVNEMDINDMIDTNLYLNSFNIADREFYKKIFKTKMFREFIIKRVDPKYNKEKIEAIFFEEKINERLAEKKMFGKTKIKEQNVLLSSKDYDYLPELEIIDLSNQKISSGVTELFKDKCFIKEDCLNNGYVIEENNGNFVFSYYIFPSLFDSKFFLLNMNFYEPAPILYKQVDSINSKIVKKTAIKFNKKPVIKKYKIENDLYICYIILWSLTFWYTEDKEKDYRFKQLLLILEKINQEKLEVFQLLFENMIKWGASDDEIFLIYIKLLQQKLKSNWTIFNMIIPVLTKKEMDIKSNPTAQLLKLTTVDLNNNKLKEIDYKNTFSKRTIKSRNEFEENIIIDEVNFICYTNCIWCGQAIDTGRICSDLAKMHTRKKNQMDQFKCPHKTRDGDICDYFTFLKIKFKYGVNLYNPKISKYNTSKYFSLPLLSISTLKEKLFSIMKQYKDSDTRIDIGLFKNTHRVEFWNSIWYFALNGKDISFILPYSETERINETDLSINIIPKNLEDHKVNIINDNKNIEIQKSNSKYKYSQNDLCPQILYQFAFLIDIGMISFKNIFLYEDNINYNELPLIFENALFMEGNEERIEEPSLIRCVTTNILNDSKDYIKNDMNTSFGNTSPITKKHNNYISNLSYEKKCIQNIL